MHEYRRLFGFVRPYLGRLLFAALLLAISGALMGAVVSTIKPLVNDVLHGVSAGGGSAGAAVPAGSDILGVLRDWLPLERFSGWARRHAFVEVPLLLVAIFVIRGVIGYVGQYETVKAGARTIRDVRLALYRAVARQSLSFFQDHPTGAIVSRILNDVSRLQKLATTSLANALRVGAMIPTLLFVALVHDWRMSLLAIVALPLLGYPMVRLGRRLRRAAIVSQESTADVAHRITEAVGGVRVVQGFGMEEYEIDRVRDAIERVLRADLRAGRAAALSPAIMELFGACIGAVLFYVAGRSIAVDALDPGNFAVVLFCLGILFVSIRRLNQIYAELQSASAAGERIFEFLDRTPEIVDAPDAAPLAPFRDAVRFEGVEFAYGSAPVLHGVDLELRRGEVVALVGASGSGKSTLANLLPRFYDPTAGRITVDGVDLRSVTLDSLRSAIGLVTQETVLFDDTLRNNIAYGRPDVGLEPIREAARAAHADGFIGELEQGYETVVGEGGARLSVGQRQRVTIARALLKDPPILILDEATSALDAESEALVQQALDELMRGRTSLVIAHRLATVRRADRIVVLDGGRVVEQGTHDALLAADGVYARLHALQFEDHAP